MKKLAIVPARGGSKRIPRKNIREFCGKPIIAYSIEALLGAGIFDEVMVSTDDAEIAEIAIKYGAKVPFMRSNEMSNDHATVMDSVYEVVQQYKAMGEEFDYCAVVYATAPFVTSEVIKNAMDVLISNDCDGVMPIVQYSYPPQRGLSIGENGKVSLINPEYENTRSQDLPPIYHDSGLFDCFRCKSFLKNKTFFTDNVLPIVLPEIMVQDIDTEQDWTIAELKFKLLDYKN